MEMCAGLPEEEDVFGEAGVGGEEEWCAAVAIAEMDRTPLGEEEVQDGKGG